MPPPRGMRSGYSDGSVHVHPASFGSPTPAMRAASEARSLKGVSVQILREVSFVSIFTPLSAVERPQTLHIGETIVAERERRLTALRDFVGFRTPAPRPGRALFRQKAGWCSFR